MENAIKTEMLVEKYRPTSFAQIIGQEDTIKLLAKMAEKGDIPHLLLVGEPGTGKTTAGLVMCRALLGDMWRSSTTIFNASSTRGIATVRDDIQNLVDLQGRRIIFLDEFDNFTEDAQEALRALMEKASTKKVRFILTANNPGPIIDAIQSRCAKYTFKRLEDRDILKKLIEIAVREGVSKETIIENKKSLEIIATKSNGDLRNALNQLQAAITPEKELNLYAALREVKSSLAAASLDASLAGEVTNAIKNIEDAYIIAKYSADDILKELYIAIKVIPEVKIKLRLLYELSKTSDRIKRAKNPIIHLTSFVAYAWIVKYLPDGCPIKEGKSD